MTILDWCIAHGATCSALDWLRARPDAALEVLWGDCEVGDWMLWFAGRLCSPGDELHRAIVRAGVACAQTARRHALPEHLPVLDEAYAAALAWEAEPTAENQERCRAADYAATAAAYAAVVADATRAAAYAAAYAASAAADAAAAADAYAASAAYAADAAVVALAAEAAAHAAEAAEAAADPKAAHLRCAEIVRKHVPLALVAEAWERVTV